MAVTPGVVKRRELAKQGLALPDGSFPIQDKEDLKKAISAFGLGKHSSLAKAHIIKRAKALGATDLLPSKWQVAVVKHSDDVEIFLEHFGVKGMHWGVVHEPNSNGRIRPSAEEKAAATQVKREVNAQKYLRKADDFQSQINTLNASTYRFKFQQKNAQANVKELSKFRDQALADAEKKRQGKLSSTQKKVVVGAVVVGSILAAATVYSAVESGQLRQVTAKGKAFVTRTSAVDFKKNESLAKAAHPDEVFEKVVKHVNPGYGAPGTKNNCRRCTFAYEMRRRGLDVQATKTEGGSGQNVAGIINAISPGKKPMSSSTGRVTSLYLKETNTKAAHRANPITHFTSMVAGGGQNKIPLPKIEKPGDKLKVPGSIFNHLANQPDGSRGELAVKWGSGGAHSMAYEIFNGKPVIFDNQSGHKYTSIADAAGDLIDVVEAGFTRLDNIPLNEDFLLRWVKNAK